MSRWSLRNRWVSHIGCVVLGAACCAGVWAGAGVWRDAELGGRVSGRWTLDGAHTDPAVRQVDADYRPDGSFVVWQTCTDGSTRIVEHGRWWVSAGRLYQAYTAFDSRPVRPGEQVSPARLTVARADQTLVLVWPAGHLNSFRRATG